MTEPTAPIFRALADPNRRVLLDRLFERDGQTLGELCGYLPAMTRFGVMKHLGILEEADLVTTVKAGREKRHLLNPVPIRLVHDRWISKFAEPVVGAMSAIKAQLERPMDTIDHIYSVYIKAAPDRVWRAITEGDETVRYYYGTRVASDWVTGSPLSYAYPDGSVAADGKVLEIDPGRRVVMSFHPRWDAEARIRGSGAHDLGGRARGGGRLEAHGDERPEARLEERRGVRRRHRLHRVRSQDVHRDRRAAVGRLIRIACFCRSLALYRRGSTHVWRVRTMSGNGAPAGHPMWPPVEAAPPRALAPETRQSCRRTAAYRTSKRQRTTIRSGDRP